MHLGVAKRLVHRVNASSSLKNDTELCYKEIVSIYTHYMRVTIVLLPVNTRLRLFIFLAVKCAFNLQFCNEIKHIFSFFWKLSIFSYGICHFFSCYGENVEVALELSNEWVEAG